MRCHILCPADRLLSGGMKQESQYQHLTQFTAAVYAFLREHIDRIDIEEISDSDFSSLFDLKRTIDAVVTKGMNRYQRGNMT
jgi:hypothetical protein